VSGIQRLARACCSSVSYREDVTIICYPFPTHADVIHACLLRSQRTESGWSSRLPSCNWLTLSTLPWGLGLVGHNSCLEATHHLPYPPTDWWICCSRCDDVHEPMLRAVVHIPVIAYYRQWPIKWSSPDIIPNQCLASKRKMVAFIESMLTSPLQCDVCLSYQSTGELQLCGATERASSHIRRYVRLALS